ncbi:MAG: acetyl-CoA carboxylase carboxyltransferase subunit [Robiginitomaculum sp.]|nr:MAG: acetyl-CoA carboxylase carboxyltransferase subunit [Robiginitomaculum sp.]
MTVFQSKISSNSPAFAQNREDMLALVEKLRALESRAEAVSEKRRPRFEQRGQLTPRDRLKYLLDPGMPFVELFNMASYLVDDKNPDTSLPGASSLAGIGFVNGVRCAVLVSDSGINAGASTIMSADKAIKVLDLALKHKLPLVHLVESAGANLMSYQVEMWAVGGGLFRRLANLSAAGIPTFVVLHGPSTAGGAYLPGLSDYVIGVKKNGMAALAGAALVQAATGEIADPAELGSSEMHASISGLVEYLAEDDAHGLQICRDLISRLDWNKNCDPHPERDIIPPAYDADELAGVVPVDYRKPYDAREVIARLVDGSDFLEFKPGFGAGTVCVQARIFGHAVGIIGNNGPFDPDSAAKATQFFQLCDQLDTPIVFLHNITGYMVGTEYEQKGMIKHGSKMIQAVANVRVPKLSLYIGASFGAGNYGMCGYDYNPDFLFAWPNAKTGVMGGEQAATTMDVVGRAIAKRKGVEMNEQMEQMFQIKKQEIIDLFEPQSDAFYTSGRLLDNGIIDPRDSRKILGFALETCWESRHRSLKPNSFGVARI